MIKRENAPLFVILLLYALAIAMFFFLGMNSGITFNPTYEKLYNKYIVYRIGLPGDSFEAERKFAFKLLEGAQEIKRDFPVSTDTIFFDPEVFMKYLPKGSGHVTAYLNDTSLVINYVSENANRVSVVYPKNTVTENINYLFIDVPNVESLCIYYRPEYITYNNHSSSKGQIFYPEGKTPAEPSRRP